MEVVHVHLFGGDDGQGLQVLQLPEVGVHRGVDGEGMDPVADKPEILIAEVDFGDPDDLVGAFQGQGGTLVEYRYQVIVKYLNLSNVQQVFTDDNRPFSRSQIHSVSNSCATFTIAVG